MKPGEYLLVLSPDTREAANQMVTNVRALNTINRIGPKGSDHDMLRPTPVVIGIWDLGAWIGGLARLVSGMNRSQQIYRFFEVEAAVPAGLISRPERMATWLAERLGRELDSTERDEIQDNVIADDYYGIAEAIRSELKLDYLVGITPSMVAGYYSSSPHWNYFSMYDRQLILASTFQLREFARQTKQPFEAYLATVIIAQVLVAQFWPRVGFHPETRACLFDYNGDRISIREKVRALKIEPSCMTGIDEAYRPAAQALVDFVRTLRKE